MRSVCLGILSVCLLNFPVSAGEETAAERGKRAITTRSFLSPAWSERAFAEAGKLWTEPAPDASADPAAYSAAFARKYGLHPAPYENDGLPMGLRKAASPDGSKKGLQLDCMVCHGGSIGGKSYVGLGNTQVDLKALLVEMTKADGKTPPLSLFTINSSRGTVNAGQIDVVLLSLRNPDMTFRKFPLMTGANLPELDTPPWWNLRKKLTKYYDGRTDARSARSNMQFMLGELTKEQFEKLEPTFVDIQEYFKTIEPPKYPFAVEQEKADRGRKVFEANCVRCHGTYGGNPTYPNKIVPLDIIGTDPARSKGLSDRFVAHYNATWFADYKVNEEAVGYQAPPLDGVWATAPYLHNGSVPTLWHLLKTSDRPATFLRPESTDFEHYDRQKAGWKAEPFDPSHPPATGCGLRRVALGIIEQGAMFGDKLTDAERWDLIEYLKTL